MRALVRPPSLAFVDALGQVEGHAPIDLQLALRQHADYAEALGRVGCELVALPSDDDLPDACFVEDTAIVLGECALITRPGAPSRRPEVLAVAAALASHGLTLTMMEAPATLDGGDCLRLGTTIYVGRSARTNDLGVSFLRQMLSGHGITVVSVPLPPEVLHLKCVCARLDDDRVLVAEGALPEDTFGETALVRIPADEAYAANVLAVGGAVLCADGFPRTQETLESAGFRTIPLLTTEARKADGALTCMSILL